MMDCLYAECTPCITDCVMAELEKLGQKYRVALKIAKVGPARTPCLSARLPACLPTMVLKSAKDCPAVGSLARRRLRAMVPPPLLLMWDKWAGGVEVELLVAMRRAGCVAMPLPSACTKQWCRQRQTRLAAPAPTGSRALGPSPV